MDLSERIREKLSGYITPRGFDELIGEELDEVAQLEAELAEERETFPYTVKLMSEDEWFRKCSPKNYERLKQLEAENAELVEALDKIAQFGANDPHPSSDLLLVQVWANQALAKARGES